MMSLASLYLLAPDPAWPTYLSSLTTPLLENWAAVDGKDSSPSWLERRTTTEVATRLEGLVAALEVQRSMGDGVRANSLSQTILVALAYCYERQVSAHHELYFDDEARGGFTQSLSMASIRIDYAQHVANPAH
jgi:hypothetical protein